MRDVIAPILLGFGMCIMGITFFFGAGAALEGLLSSQCNSGCQMGANFYVGLLVIFAFTAIPTFCIWFFLVRDTHYE